MLRYVQRVVLLALLVQPLYVVAMHHTSPAMYAVSFAEEPARAALNFYIESCTTRAYCSLCLWG